MSQESPFGFFSITAEGADLLHEIRAAFDKLYFTLKGIVPAGREFALVTTKLEEASFYAIRGTAKEHQRK